MEIVFIIIALLLVITIGILIMYNMSLNKKIKEYSNTNQKINNLNVLQDFIDTIGEDSSTDEKIKKINNILIERYEIKYSTIVIYDGAEYTIRASNVAEKHWDNLKNLHKEEVFRESIQTATPKYITINQEGETLPYLKMEFARAKSAMFFPIYMDNIYVGYWIIEGNKPHEFDNVDTTILEVIKNNIVSALKTVANQSTIENIVREDKFSGLKSAEYLYGIAKKVINKYSTSTVCLFKITNLSEINEKVDRKVGNYIITKISELFKSNLAQEYFFVRYMGPKFAIVFSGTDEEGVVNFMKSMKLQIENIKIDVQNFGKSNVKIVSPKINVAITTYYKGTALEGVTKKLEEYLDNADSNENNINCL
ncbi:MAG TPA: diguanylate cyclase [Clostridiaceae bacterium]|nr:diguanylate cyclase [Clostridiaceae bacterium]